MVDEDEVRFEEEGGEQDEGVFFYKDGGVVRSWRFEAEKVDRRDEE